MEKNTILPVPKKLHPKSIGLKTLYPIIDVPASGNYCWIEGAYSLLFVYSKYKGNFILRGYLGEVEKYLKENYTHYIYYRSMWYQGQSRGGWKFWKDRIGIFEPSKMFKTWKYQIREYSNWRDVDNDVEEKSLYFKRIPHRWIPEFDKL